MAVSMNTGSNVRADFMISDAALPMRMEELAEEQAGMFARLLGDIGSAKGELAAKVEEVTQKYSDLKAAGEAAIYRDKETGRILPEDPRKLAKMILKGEVDFKNVPAELITPELMRWLAVMSKTKELADDEEEDDEDTLFDSVDAITAEQNFQQELSNAMLMELYQIIEKHNEREAEDKVTILDGISEPIDETETLPSPITAEEHKEADEGLFAELIDNLVETVTEGLEQAEEAAVPVVGEVEEVRHADDNIGQTAEVRPEKAAELGISNAVTDDVKLISEVDIAAKPDMAEPIKPVAKADTPEVKTEAVFVRPEAEGSAASEVPTVVADQTGAPAEQIVIPQQTEVEAQAVVSLNEQTASLNEQATVSLNEQAVVTPNEQAAVSLNEQTGENVQKAAVPVEEFTVRTVKTEQKPEVAENSMQTKEVEEPIVVKTVTRNEDVQQLDKTPDEAPKQIADPRERVKSAAEEFEMLKNAKAKAAKPVTEEKLEVKPEHAAQPLNADSPIVLRKADGSEIEVRPSEIIDQTAKLVEKAVTENDDKTEYSLVLNPEELGKITVKLIKAADGAVSVTIAAENARTQRILEQHSDLMQSNLRSNGVNLESWQTVGERQQETMAQDYNGSSKNPYYRYDSGNAEENSDEKSFADIIASM